MENEFDRKYLMSRTNKSVIAGETNKLYSSMNAYMQFYGNVVSYAARLLELTKQPQSEKNLEERRGYSQALLMHLDICVSGVPGEFRKYFLDDAIVKAMEEYCKAILDGKNPDQVKPGFSHALRTIAPD
jgi:hypothetical protein